VRPPDPKLERQRFIVRDANGHALAYVYFDEELGRDQRGRRWLTVTLLLQPKKVVLHYH
jgi:hypothetical protein